ncbi:hypothetical protein, partial [Mycobacterium marinum]|uniref:hypothetical protein n=1 Tax=Mycobacterium marinum TaxID=1781 RepID=UPI0035688559
MIAKVLCCFLLKFKGGELNMAEPMKRKNTDIESEIHQEENKQKEPKNGFFKRAFRRFKEDVKYGSRVEEGSLIDN